jgi:H+/Na+-translocating ferredoxin:NAD+ oxidoreductase subunit G
MKDVLKIAVILFVVCGLAAGSLSFVNLATKDRIAAFAKEEKIAALKRIFPTADSFTELAPAKGGGEATDWNAVAGGAVVGSLHLLRPLGYSGTIELVFGEDTAGALTGVQVLTHTETPGLGAKITTAAWTDQFKGKARGQVVLKKDSPSGAIDAISAATISSRAVTRAVHDAMGGAVARPGAGGN